MTLANCITILALGLCVWTSPIRVGLVFGGLLLWGTLVAGQGSGRLGLVGFIIYVGGALVLLSYGFMPTPRLVSHGGVARPRRVDPRWAVSGAGRWGLDVCASLKV